MYIDLSQQILPLLYSLQLHNPGVYNVKYKIKRFGDVEENQKLENKKKIFLKILHFWQF